MEDDFVVTVTSDNPLSRYCSAPPGLKSVVLLCSSLFHYFRWEYRKKISSTNMHVGCSAAVSTILTDRRWRSRDKKKHGMREGRLEEKACDERSCFQKSLG